MRSAVNLCAFQDATSRAFEEELVRRRILSHLINVDNNILGLLALPNLRVDPMNFNLARESSDSVMGMPGLREPPGVQGQHAGF